MKINVIMKIREFKNSKNHYTKARSYMYQGTEWLGLFILESLRILVCIPQIKRQCDRFYIIIYLSLQPSLMCGIRIIASPSIQSSCQQWMKNQMSVEQKTWTSGASLTLVIDTFSLQQFLKAFFTVTLRQIKWNSNFLKCICRKNGNY